MDEELQKKIDSEFDKLPNEIREAINSVNWIELCKRIGLRSLLNDSEIKKIQIEVFAILISTELYENLKENLEHYVALTDSEADKICAELITEVFKPIENKLKENIEKSGRVERATWKQNINFIVSGGNYAAFLDEIKD